MGVGQSDETSRSPEGMVGGYSDFPVNVPFKLMWNR